MSDNSLLVDIGDGVARLTLNRPHAMNALSPDVTLGLMAALDRIEADDSVRAVVLTGTGKAFCAGGDLKGFRETLGGGHRERFVRNLQRGQRMMRRLEMLPMPVIAAVNGVAVAGGLELILCCDLVVACESARIGDGHARFGIIPGAGSSIRLPRKIPVNLAKELLLTGELKPAAELAQWGLVNRVVPDDQLAATVDELVARIVRNSPLGLRWIKKLVDDGLEQPLDPALRSEINAFESYAASEDILEGLAAFVEKRAPHFTGR